MTRRYRKIIIAVLALLLGLSSVLQVSAGVADCAPKACCCSAPMPTMAQHGPLMERPSHCTPKEQAPCCQIEPYEPDAVVAVTPVRTTLPHRLIIARTMSDTGSTRPQNFGCHSISIDDGQLKVPWAPLYLQNQSFLC